MSDMFLGSQTPMYQNVRICRRSKTGKILEERQAKNRVTRLMLYGIGKFLLGHFNDSTPDKIYEFIPRYLALGTNTPGADADSAGVTTISDVNDTRLLNEIIKSGATEASKAVKRVWIAERNMCKLNTKFSDPFIKVSIKTYISSSQYDGLSIGEAGLFSKEKDNNCLARVCFSPITKNPGEVLDIQWDITLLSYGETKYPEKLEIENGSKVTLPLKYTNKHFKEYDLGLKKYPLYNSIGLDKSIDIDEKYQDLFKYDNNGNIFTEYSFEFIKNESGWYHYLDRIGLGYMFETFYNMLIDSKLNDYSNDGKYAKFLYSVNQQVPNMFYFGNLYGNPHMESLNDDTLSTMMMFSEDKSYEHTDTKARYLDTNVSGEYVIVMPNGDKRQYKVVNNRFYKKSEVDETSWIETIYFMYNGAIVDINQQESGFTYSNGYFYETKNIVNDVYTDEFLNFSGSTDERFYIYSTDKYDTIQKTNYSIDLNTNSEIYLNDEDTTYHLSSDNYWVTGEYIKLTPIITPTNSTDKSVTWTIQNKDIATINWDGVVTAWNIGETTAIATTSNDLRAKCIIDVVKDTTFIDVDNITINPSEITLIVNKDVDQSVIVTAEVEPLFATNSTVIWSTSYEINNCITIINIGNNQVKVLLNDSGNIGTGYITATSQSGKSANCLVRVLYQNENDCDCPDSSYLLPGDCPDPSHLIQEG